MDPRESQKQRIWEDFGQFLVQETQESLAVKNASYNGARFSGCQSGRSRSAVLTELEDLALTLAQEQLSRSNTPAKQRPTRGSRTSAKPPLAYIPAKSPEHGEAQREVARLRQEQMETVRAMLDAEAHRESIDDVLRRRDLEEESSLLDSKLANATADLRKQLETVPQSIGEITASVERKEGQLRQLLRASNYLSVFEGEALQCAAEYEAQMDRIMRRAAAQIGSIGTTSASAATSQNNSNSARGKNKTVDADTGHPLPAEMEELLRNFSAALEGGAAPHALKLLEGNLEDAREPILEIGHDYDREDKQISEHRLTALAPTERASLLQRFDRMMRLFAASCAMEARKIIAEAQYETDREHEQTLGSVLRDVRREHIREIDHMRETIDRAHSMLEQLESQSGEHSSS
eukprot:INCI4390.1.p1 GENE.INCI4390.1~~INCI4390.1.p1  ORF type:complete len:406 (-),score=79.24 INCI4390.1:382-1599(-)